MFYTYILYSATLDKFYVGHTGLTLAERLKKHNSNHRGFTGKTNNWSVKYFEVFETKSLAYQRELQIKK